MKKAILLFVVALSVQSFAQSGFRPSSAYAEDFCSSPDIVVHSEFTNKFGVDNLRFLRVQNTISSGWTSAYCDCEFCRSTTTDSADFYIKAGDSCSTSAHFYPDSKKGLGMMQIKVFDPAKRSVFVVGEYRASCWGASTLFLDHEQLNVYPNPTRDKLYVQFGSLGIYTVSILTPDGRLVKTQTVDGLEHDVNISDLTPGLYAISVESSGKVFTKRFLKN